MENRIQPKEITQEDIAALADQLQPIIDSIAQVISDVARSLGEVFAQIAQTIREAAKTLLIPIESAILSTVATPRQMHLYLHGKPRIRKKWRNALWRKYFRAQRRRMA